jgi:hypothetical protein
VPAVSQWDGRQMPLMLVNNRAPGVISQQPVRCSRAFISRTPFTVLAELSMALTAQGPPGERALNLLRDAAAVLSDPARWNVRTRVLRGPPRLTP